MDAETVGILAIVALGLTCAAAWITHIFTCLFAGKYMLLIAGAFVFPVGIIHGIGIWFGVDW